VRGPSAPLMRSEMGNNARLAILATVLLLLVGIAGIGSALDLFGGSNDVNVNRVPSFESATDSQLADLQQQVAGDPDDVERLGRLGFAYLQKARETGDPAFYTKAEGVFQRALSVDGDNPLALSGMSSVALARHDFQQALVWGQKALEQSPEDPDYYGAIGDALIELGRYEEAVAAFQRMADLRPDQSSDVRTAYARELHGDVHGALEAMRSAVEAAGPKGENAAWVRLQLGHLYFNQGDFGLAEEQYEQSLEAFPGYVHALAGLGKAHAARGDYGQAISLYEQVTARQPAPEYVIALGDVFNAAGEHEQAQRQYDLVSAIAGLYQTNGVNTDLETALFFADHGLRLDDAVLQARAAYQQQPGSIHAADVLSWALYKSGGYEEALVHSKEARRLDTRDALLSFHAGMIHYGLGQDDEARGYLEQALDVNPAFSILHAEEAIGTLDELGALARN